MPDELQSPQVLPDSRLVFRIYAPKAAEVILDGELIARRHGTGRPLVKDDQGVWSITVGPLVPDSYTYTLTVDGVLAVDPQNHAIKHGVNPLQNILSVPGEEIALAQTAGVPHGDVRIVWYGSPTLSSARSMRVYTPPDYDLCDRSYSVLYLIPGGGDDRVSRGGRPLFFRPPSPVGGQPTSPSRGTSGTPHPLWLANPIRTLRPPTCVARPIRASTLTAASRSNSQRLGRAVCRCSPAEKLESLGICASTEAASALALAADFFQNVCDRRQGRALRPSPGPRR